MNAAASIRPAAAAAVAPEQYAAAEAARVPGKLGDTPFVSFAKQSEAFDAELEHILSRLRERVDQNKVHPAFAAERRKALRQASETLHALRDMEAAGQGAR